MPSIHVTGGNLSLVVVLAAVVVAQQQIQYIFTVGFFLFAIPSFVCCFVMLPVYQTTRYTWQDDGWIMNCKGFARKQSWPNQYIIQIFVWNYWRTPRKLSFTRFEPAALWIQTSRTHYSIMILWLMLLGWHVDGTPDTPPVTCFLVMTPPTGRVKFFSACLLGQSICVTLRALSWLLTSSRRQERRGEGGWLARMFER